MRLSCQPFQRGRDPRTCRTRSQIKTHSQAMGKTLSAKPPLRNNVASFRTINVVLPEKSHPSHSVTPGKGDEDLSTDWNKNRSSTKINNVHPNVEISSVPDPVPNPLVQIPSPSAAQHTTQLLDPPRTVPGNDSSSVFIYPSNSVVRSLFLPLPSTASALSSTLSLSFALPTSVSAERPLGTFSEVPSRQTSPRQLPVAAIIILAAGGVCFVAAILILTNRWIRPRRRSHPTPSLPILQNAFPPRKMGDESPLFGGEERPLSQAGVNTVPWAWTQYQSDMPKSAPGASISESGATNQMPMRYSRHVDKLQDVHHTAKSTMQEAMTKPGTRNKSLDEHPSKALSRLSSLSGLVYTASVYESAGQENIGIAVSSGQGDLEVDGAAAREYRKRASTRQSVQHFDKRRSTKYGSPDGLAYTMSPSMSPVGDGRDDPNGFHRQGRARVKAPYVGGSYLRGSAPKIPPEVNPFGDSGESLYTLPPLPDSSAGKEINSMGGALVVDSIIAGSPVSPGLSLYPEDSTTVAEDRNWTALKRKACTGDSPGTGDGESSMAAVDDRSSVARSHGVAARRLSTLSMRASEKAKHSDDRPPRVPSPPVLPSLAQMAMAHTHGQEYGDYRSPTYSLYGLYSAAS
ncbi:hypothetical protein BJV74DRAFT_802241 [Russula compacta]|nr:hypothetical protein BJV74DRAFT_802241 [Russula compacta]